MGMAWRVALTRGSCRGPHVWTIRGGRVAVAGGWVARGHFLTGRPVAWPRGSSHPHARVLLGVSWGTLRGASWSRTRSIGPPTLWRVAGLLRRVARAGPVALWWVALGRVALMGWVAGSLACIAGVVTVRGHSLWPPGCPGVSWLVHVGWAHLWLAGVALGAPGGRSSH